MQSPARPVSEIKPVRAKAFCSKHGDQRLRIDSAEDADVGYEAIKNCPDCQRAVQQKRTELINSAEIPLRYKNANIHDLMDGKMPRDVSATILRYVETFDERLAAGESLILTGPTGTGKTHAAVAIAAWVMAEHLASAKFKTVLDIIRAVRATWGRDSILNEDQVLHSFISPDLLVIDDIGVQYGTESEKLILFEIINRRYNNRKPMILTSNLSEADLHDYLGDRIIDRLSEGKGGLLAINAASRRR